jgi:hypothetical protein
MFPMFTPGGAEPHSIGSSNDYRLGVDVCSRRLTSTHSSGMCWHETLFVTPIRHPLDPRVHRPEFSRPVP